MLPWLGFSRPRISFMMVDFPAPFGPSRPYIPRPISKDTDMTPITSPYHFDTLSNTIIYTDLRIVDLIISRAEKEIKTIAISASEPRAKLSYFTRAFREAWIRPFTDKS